MQRFNLDAAPPALREFFSALARQPDGVEVALDGQVVCKVIGMKALSDTDRQTQDERDLQEEAANWAELEREAMSSERIDAIAEFLQRTGQASA
jgi:hypothetical protein